MLVSMISLGCAKNMVDSEIALAKLLEDGFDLAVEPEDADVVLINTCGFIEPAREEARAVVEDILDLKKKSGKNVRVAVMGCYAERFPEELAAAYPELDAVWGLNIHSDLARAVRSLLDSGPAGIAGIGKPERPYEGARLLSTPPSYAYLKISDGCDNRCAYCAIPDIRGRFRSRDPEAIVDEAKSLEDLGIGEIILVSQDTTCYGRDLGDPGTTIVSLVENLLSAVSVRRLRLLYAHPAHLGDDLIDLLLEEARLCRYLDLPLQHISDRMLRAMGRGYGRDRAYEILDRFAGKDFTVRTTLMTGFPGESEDDFDELLDLAESGRIQQMGVFAWSPEAGVPAASLPDRVPPETAAGRRDELMEAQWESARQWLNSRIGGEEELLIDEPAEEGWFEARSVHEAPDADGIVLVRGDGLRPGDFVNACIAGREGYDLLAEVRRKKRPKPAAGKKRGRGGRGK